MKNIAAFIDINAGKLSSRSAALIHLIQGFQQVNETPCKVDLYTFSPIDLLEIPAISSASLYEIVNLDESGILSRNQMDTIISKFSSEAYDILIGYKSTLVDSIMARVSTELKLPLIPQIVSIDLAPSEMLIKQSIFSGKALSNLKIGYASVIQFNPSFAYKPIHESLMKVESVKLALSNSSSFSVSAINKIPQGANLGDANYVVGAGRGLKDPSNWGMIEELASKLGAATACSKPVSDINWRPHSEHVGQTGIKIAPKLYIACGISGAIQHLAGVNGSKTIIVINNDPEAPFFKYADYGIVGDVFDVIPEIVKNL